MFSRSLPFGHSGLWSDCEEQARLGSHCKAHSISKTAFAKTKEAVVDAKLWNIDKRISLMAEIKVPEISGAGPKLSIGRWFKRVGDPVTVHEPLVEVDTDNVTHEIQAPITGVLVAILVKDGGSVEPGTLLGIVEPV